jgi:hypothetical protein
MAEDAPRPRDRAATCTMPHTPKARQEAGTKFPGPCLVCGEDVDPGHRRPRTQHDDCRTFRKYLRAASRALARMAAQGRFPQ